MRPTKTKIGILVAVAVLVGFLVGLSTGIIETGKACAEYGFKFLQLDNVTISLNPSGQALLQEAINKGILDR